MQFGGTREFPCAGGQAGLRLRVTSQAHEMSTPPLTERTQGRVRKRRLLARVPIRTAWLTADLVAVAACVVLAVRGF